MGDLLPRGQSSARRLNRRRGTIRSRAVVARDSPRTRKGKHVDRIEDMAGAFNPGGIQQYLQDISWPIGKDDLTRVLQRNGAPSRVVDNIQGSNQSQFDGPEDVMNAAQGS